MQPSWALAALVGLMGSTLLLVKPYYAVMVLAPALLVAAHRRNLKSLFALEHWVIGWVCVAYLGTVTLVYPEFLRDVYPLLSDVYARISFFQHTIIRYGSIWCILLFSVWRLWPTGRFPELAAVVLAASTAGMFPLLYQAKGWPYHAYPAIFCAVAAILCLLAYRRTEQRSVLSLLPGPGLAVALAGLLVAFHPFWSFDKPDPVLAAAVRAATDRPTVALMGSDIAAGHPFNRMINGRFVSSHVSDWLGGSSLYLSRRAVNSDPAEAKHYDAIMARYAEGKCEEFERLRPDIIIFDKSDRRWTRQLTERFGFDTVLARYRILAENDALRIYLRADYIHPASSAEKLATLPSSPASK